MIKIIKNGEVYSPDYQGKKDILILGDKIGRIAENIEISDDFCMEVEVIDAAGKIIVPGFIDNHVHILGGGGEGGYKTRTPEIKLTDLTRAGVTTVIGCLGTDGITRTMTNLVAKARSLEEEGISTWILTGSYQIPVRTLTGNIEEDLILIDKIIGVGEIAVSDHRSSQPVKEAIAQIAGSARVGGILSGKAGIVNIHMGDGKRMLEFLNYITEQTEIPYTQLLPTHMGRNPELFAECIKYVLKGGYADFTTSTTPLFLEEGEIKCSKALKLLLEKGADSGHITFSSDGQGSLPDFDEAGRLKGLTVGTCSSLLKEVRDAVKEENIPLETAIKVITSNLADLFKLRNKGYIKEKMDADINILSKDLEIETVISKGNFMIKENEIIQKGTFE